MPDQCAAKTLWTTQPPYWAACLAVAGWLGAGVEQYRCRQAGAGQSASAGTEQGAVLRNADRGRGREDGSGSLNHHTHRERHDDRDAHNAVRKPTWACEAQERPNTLQKLGGFDVGTPAGALVGKAGAALGDAGHEGVGAAPRQPQQLHLVPHLAATWHDACRGTRRKRGKNVGASTAAALSPARAAPCT